MSLSKKTKAQLTEMATELGIDVAGTRKSDFIDAIEAHRATVSKPAGASTSTSSSSSSSSSSESSADDSSDVDIDDSDFEIEYIYNISLIDAIKEKKILQFLEFKSLEARDYLSDPFSINDLAFYIETAVLALSLSKWTTLDSYLPNAVSDVLPNFVNSLTTLDVSNTFCLVHIFAMAFWVLSGYFLPQIGSYYINFSEFLDHDAFVACLVKLFVSVIVFKSELPSVFEADVKYNIVGLFSGNGILQTINYAIVLALAHLRFIFGNWVLIEAAFSAVLALYANLTLM